MEGVFEIYVEEKFLISCYDRENAKGHSGLREERQLKSQNYKQVLRDDQRASIIVKFKNYHN